MIIPDTQEEYIKSIARETARMSYPLGMSRGKKPIHEEGPKKYIEEKFFLTFLDKFRVNHVANCHFSRY